ncbi:uncharacterized protein LOC135388233 [Ornithodoros turicata]|uniref:uncharacterized protein LOC135388233 n=1 Tax=Ornithodoros turicata TaxID=34597 RepID=UPI003139A02B
MIYSHLLRENVLLKIFISDVYASLPPPPRDMTASDQSVTDKASMSTPASLHGIRPETVQRQPHMDTGDWSGTCSFVLEEECLGDPESTETEPTAIQEPGDDATHTTGTASTSSVATVLPVPSEILQPIENSNVPSASQPSSKEKV